MFDDMGYQAYQQEQLEAKAAAADPQQLVVMLIDGFLDELERVEGHIQAKNFERKAQSIKKCMDILGGLDAALDLEAGGEVAMNLHRLYDYCGRKLLDVSANMDNDALASIRQVMNDLREGWGSLAA